MTYAELPDEDLAREVARQTSLSFESALRAIQSEDPDLGRSWAEGLLGSLIEHEQRQEQISRHRAVIRRAATAR